MKRLLSLIACVILASGCGGDSSGPSTVTLPLTSVDARALPTTVPSATGTVQVASGRLTGSGSGPACSWYVAFNPGGESFGSIGDCTVDAGDIITLTFQIGPTAGSHAYRFGQ